MMQKIEHIGIAVRDIDAADKLYTILLGSTPYKREVIESEQVVTSFFRVGASKIELVCSLDPEGVIAKFVEKKGEGIHHIAFDVTDIHAELERLEKEGFRIISKEPKKGADNKLVAFLHPKSTNGVLIELCQEIEKK